MTTHLSLLGPARARSLARSGSLLLACISLLACTGPGATTPVGSEGEYSVDAWADNWFSLSIGDELIIEDSVSITTERSFNAESFGFDATPPFVLSWTLKDFKENDSGLEYIGQPNQQMGDGGFIVQIRRDGETVHVSDASWRCLVIHEGPLDTSCERSSNPLEDCSWESQDEPAGWRDEDFDDSGWVSASTFSEAQVDPKDGYDEISWDSSAELVWTSDLETHNTILCRSWINE